MLINKSKIDYLPNNLESQILMLFLSKMYLNEKNDDIYAFAQNE
ncbi:MAG: hypothetical protein PWQ81_385 [Bacteroidota bacterium]|jgi:hypothetical protein|nr:hypothetical protein [Bacteroidota bacterium]MDK2837360.1 hypothetical protein [Bacteroidota bacterium]MDK2969664.1 hypothetical protein [Bacteroidota bacterium]